MTPEQFAELQASYMQAVTVFLTDVLPVVGVLVSALFGWALGKLPGVVR